jgi:hypothetical protein
MVRPTTRRAPRPRPPPPLPAPPAHRAHDLPQPHPQLLAHDGVERTKGLVQEQQVGVGRERARERDALPLAAAQLRARRGEGQEGGRAWRRARGSRPIGAAAAWLSKRCALVGLRRGPPNGGVDARHCAASLGKRGLQRCSGPPVEGGPLATPQESSRRRALKRAAPPSPFKPARQPAGPHLPREARPQARQLHQLQKVLYPLVMVNI